MYIICILFNILYVQAGVRVAGRVHERRFHGDGSGDVRGGGQGGNHAAVHNTPTECLVSTDMYIQDIKKY